MNLVIVLNKGNKMITAADKIIKKVGEAQFCSDYNPKGTKYLEAIAMMLFYIHQEKLEKIILKE